MEHRPGGAIWSEMFAPMLGILLLRGASALVGGAFGRISQDKDLVLAFGGNRTVKVVFARNPIIDYLRKTRGDLQ
jgi:hypothetical protein